MVAPAPWRRSRVTRQAIARETGLCQQRVLRALTHVREAVDCDVPQAFRVTVAVDEAYLWDRTAIQRTGDSYHYLAEGRPQEFWWHTLRHISPSMFLQNEPNLQSI